MTVEKEALTQFKHRNAFEITDFYLCDIVPLINRAWKKYFARRNKNLEVIIDRGWFHLDRRLLKEPVILKTKISLDNEKLDDQHDLPLRTHPPIPASISTDKLKIFSDITPPNHSSVLSLDMNTSEQAAGDLATDYLQMI